MKRSFLFLLAATVAWTGILAGTDVIEMVVHLPARHRLGAEAYADYLRATLLTRGIILYPILGIGGALLSWATFLLALGSGVARAVKVLLGVAAGSTLAGMAVAWRGRQVLLALGDGRSSVPILSALLDRFATLQSVRGTFVEVTFYSCLVALAVLASRGSVAEWRKALLPLLLVTTAMVAIMGGGALPMSIVDRPAWHQIGAVAYTEYARVTDTGPAKFMYPPLAFLGLLLTLVTFGIARKAGAGRGVVISVAVAAVSAALVLVMTTQAAPNLLRALRSPSDESVLAPLLARFDAWSWPRAIFLLATFWAMLSALAIRARGERHA